jgi:hypothetical protein
MTSAWFTKLAIQFLDGFELGFDRFTLTIDEAWMFRGEDPNHVDFEGSTRIVHEGAFNSQAFKIDCLEQSLID